MMHFICAAIDGTNSKKWRREDGANSHVSRFQKDFAADDTDYWDGPGTLGLEMGHVIGEVTQWVFSKVVDAVQRGARQEDVKIVLVGHSRGAVAAMAVANRLSEYMPVAFLPPSIEIRCPIRVQFLGLYDAVDRSLAGHDGSLTNVDTVCHAMRANRRWSGSRYTFGTVKVGRGKAASFDTAHGGVGGDPGYFEDVSKMMTDPYCNALRLVLTDAELLQRFGTVTVGDPDGMAATTFPRYMQLTGKARDERIEELLRAWNASWEADQFIRAGAAASCGPDRFRQAASHHHPFAPQDAHLAQRLGGMFGLSLSH